MKLERLCHYVCRPGIAEKRWSFTLNGGVWYQLKIAHRDRMIHEIFESLLHRAAGGAGAETAGEPEVVAGLLATDRCGCMR